MIILINWQFTCYGNLIMCRYISASKDIYTHCLYLCYVIKVFNDGFRWSAHFVEVCIWEENMSMSLYEKNET